MFQQSHGHSEQTCGCQGGGERSQWMGSLGLWMQTIPFRMENQWGPTVQHRELYPITRDRTCWKTVWEKECVWPGHYAVQQKLTWHCKSTLIKNLKKKRQLHEKKKIVSGLAGVTSVPTRKISAIYSTVHLMKVNTRRSLNSVIEPDYLGWIISGRGWIPG